MFKQLKVNLKVDNVRFFPRTKRVVGESFAAIGGIALAITSLGYAVSGIVDYLGGLKNNNN